MECIFPFFHFLPIVSLNLTLVSYRQHILGSCFSLSIVNLCLLIEEIFMFKTVTDKEKLLLLVSFYCVLRTETAGSYGNSVFHCLNNLRTIFCSGCTILPFQQQCTRVTHSLYTYHTLLSVVVGFFFCLFLFLFFFFLIGALLTDVR